MRKVLEITILCVISLAFIGSFYKDFKPWSNGFNNGFSCSTEDITNMYADYVEDWKKQTSEAFDKAESEVFKDNPIPEVVGIDPDPDKCICGGSGWITHGDGHKTKCPYHGEGMGDILEDHGLLIHKN